MAYLRLPKTAMKWQADSLQKGIESWGYDERKREGMYGWRKKHAKHVLFATFTNKMGLSDTFDRQ